MKTRRQSLGRWGEDLSAHYLQERGYLILDRNVRTPYGEIDLVTRQNEQIVFVEVKTRSTASFGPPEEAVTQRKQSHLLSAALAYLQNHPELGDYWRIDVVAIRLPNSGAPEIVHFENAVT